MDCSSEEQTSDVITWYKDGQVVLEDFSHVLTKNGAVLTVRDLRAADRGRYECEVTDRPTGELIRRQTFVVTAGGLCYTYGCRSLQDTGGHVLQSSGHVLRRLTVGSKIEKFFPKEQKISLCGFWATRWI